jgi:hypothetical protein
VLATFPFHPFFLPGLLMITHSELTCVVLWGAVFCVLYYILFVCVFSSIRFKDWFIIWRTFNVTPCTLWNMLSYLDLNNDDWKHELQRWMIWMVISSCQLKIETTALCLKISSVYFLSCIAYIIFRLCL